MNDSTLTTPRLSFKPWHLDSIALLAGVLTVIAFAPFNIPWLAVFAPLLLLLTLKTTPARALARGYLFGLGFFGLGTSWVFVSIYRFSGSGLLLAILVTLLLIMILAIFTALPCYLATKWRQEKSLAIYYFILFPSLWVIFEYLRSFLFTGFPWLLLGYSQTDSAFSGLAPILGVYGLSYLVLLYAGAIIYAFKITRPRALLVFIMLFALMGLAWFCHSMAWTKPIGKPRTVAIIQGNIPQQLKWNPQEVSRILQTYYRLSLPQWRHNIIVWPEGAIPLVKADATGFLNDLKQLAKAHNSALLTGIATTIPQSLNYHNALLTLGNAHGIYFKRHLVPFGEYVPFQKWLRPFQGLFNLPMSSFVPGPKNQPLLTVAGLHLAPFLCYEIVYPEEVIRSLHNANAMVVISDDSWFGHSIASAQQFQFTRFRALETGRYILVANNSGVSAIINTQGQVTTQAHPFQAAVVDGSLQAVTGKTPIMRLTPRYLILLIILLLLVGGLWQTIKHYQTNE